MKLTAFPDHATAPPPKPAGLPAPSIENMRLSEFAGSGLVREVRSRVLDEHVLFVADTAVLPQNNRLVVYRAGELTELVGLPPEQLRAIHAVKKVARRRAPRVRRRRGGCAHPGTGALRARRTTGGVALTKVRWGPSRGDRIGTPEECWSPDKSGESRRAAGTWFKCDGQGGTGNNGALPVPPHLADQERTT